MFFFFQAEDGIRDLTVTGVQTCALPISLKRVAVENVIAAADDRLPVGERRPGEVDARRYVVLVGGKDVTVLRILRIALVDHLAFQPRQRIDTAQAEVGIRVLPDLKEAVQVVPDSEVER